jgi:phage baseplate assembly protein W
MSRLSDSAGQSLVSRKKGWADLDLSLTPHPIRKDIIPLKDNKAIVNAVKNLLQTNFYERPFQSTLGANLRGLLFEPNDVITRIALRENIREVLTVSEPRISLQAIYVEEASQGTAFRITVLFRIKEYNTDQSVEIVLRRLR